MSWLLHCLEKYQYLALWLEGIALVAIFIWDRLDNRAEHKQTRDQLKLAQEQASAALIAASAAKKSADMTAEIQRPHAGIASVIMGGGDRYFNTRLDVRNFGALAAMEVIVKLEYFVEDRLRWSHTEPSTLQLFPGDIHHVTNQFDSDIPDAAPIRAGNKQLKAKVFISYQTHDGREFEYVAELTYVYTSGQMTMLNSSTSQKK